MWTLTSSVPPMNEVTFGQNVTLLGANLDTLPSRLLIGPFVVSVIIVSPTMAVLKIPAGTTTASCAGMTDEELSYALSTVNPSSIDALFASVTLQHTTVSLSTLRALCATQGRGFEPAMFTVGVTIIVAPNITGFTASSQDPETYIDTKFQVAGETHPFTISVPQIGPGVVPADMLPLVTSTDDALTIGTVAKVSQARRQTAVQWLYYTAPLTLDPTKRGTITTNVTIEMPTYLQRWSLSVTVPVLLPQMQTGYFLSNGYALSFGVQLTNGTTLHTPSMTFDTYNTQVPVTLNPVSSACVWNQAVLRVVCNSSALLHRAQNVSELLYFDIQVLVPAYYNGDVNVTATAFALNSDSVVSVVRVTPNPLTDVYNYTRAPIAVAPPPPQETPAAALAPLSAAGIFQPQPDGNINFVVLTLAAYAVLMVLRMIYFVYRRHQNAAVTDPADVTVMQSLITHHVWLGMILPCTYHCGHKHITLAVCTVMGAYAIVSSFAAYGTKDILADLRAQILIGMFAAFTQVCIRPILNAMFFLYSIFDETELIIEEKPVQFQFDEADYVEDIEMLAPKHFEDEDIVEMDMLDGDDDLQFADMTMDEVLEKATREKVSMGGSIGRAHLDDALDGLDSAIPLDEDDIILERGIDDENMEDLDAMIDIELDLMEPEVNQRAALTLSHRGGTLAKISADLVDIGDGSNGSGDENLNQTASTTGEEGEDDYDDEVIVTRHLHNYTRYGYVVCFVYLALTALVTILNTAGWNKPTLANFWWSMIFAGITSFVVFEPLLMFLIWLYRWLLDDDDDLTTDMHPFEGEERFRRDA